MTDYKMSRKFNTNSAAYVPLTALLAWLVPGAGHLLIKHKKRGIIIFAAISFLFVLGLFVGSIAVINPVQDKLWYMAQILTSPLIAIIGKITVHGNYQSYGKPFEVGQIYTSIAGLLNLLCIINAVYIAYTGKLPPEPEDE